MAENIEKVVTENNYIPTPEDFKIVGPDTTQSEEIYKPSLTFWQDGWRRFKKNKLALTFLGITIIFLFLAIFGQHLTKYSYRAQDLSEKFLSPSKGIVKGHYLGTDNLGRDLFARLSQGIRISMELSIITAAICVVFGTIYGAVSAYFGGIIDTIMTRIVEILLIIPSMIYIILLMVVMGNSVQTICIGFKIAWWKFLVDNFKALDSKYVKCNNNKTYNRYTKYYLYRSIFKFHRAWSTDSTGFIRKFGI